MSSTFYEYRDYIVNLGQNQIDGMSQNEKKLYDIASDSLIRWGRNQRKNAENSAKIYQMENAKTKLDTNFVKINSCKYKYQIIIIFNIIYPILIIGLTIYYNNKLCYYNI